MNRPTFNQTVDVLVKAYLNDELAHKLCTACAVGNIVAAKMQTHPAKNLAYKFDCWTYENGQLSRIENAFESAPGDPEKDSDYITSKERFTDPTWMFNGLMAVVDVLAEIHGVDLTVKESAKLLFTK